MKKITRAQFLSYGGLTILGGLLLTMIGINNEWIFSNEETPAEPPRRKWIVLETDLIPSQAYQAIAEVFGLEYYRELDHKFSHRMILKNIHGSRTTFHLSDDLESSLQRLAAFKNLELRLNQTTIKVGNSFETVPAYHYLSEKV